ncbi:YbhB/YbcL family Raf kinase inhibitor-like protein [Candidatus Raskinella chloraquaticus]|jgi:phosphatidylethanolamine-binding protein (PEBP) family uncharacterized protein|uniref:YbhB/YbcL family Raf kinase inhibitor-like protein n=1 Tax=Candidatus Raskinella chloraquaticus TaxID=1951219 RepID=UPI00268628DD
MMQRVLCASVLLLAASLPAHAMTASVRWCSGSPEFKISGAPKGASMLNLQMSDLDYPSYNHAGGVLPFATLVKCGALSSSPYRGPSPPAGQVHTYRWTIEALDASGKVLEKVVVDKKFPEQR